MPSRGTGTQEVVDGLEGLEGEARARVADLLLAMERLPAQPTIAMRVLWMCNDPDVSVAEVADMVEIDPVLTARLLRLANSPYYSLRSTVANPHRAVVMLGCTTVGAVAAAAVAASAGLEQVPTQFWAHSAAVAVACQLVAESFGVSTSDAFATGLLHDIGAGLLRVSNPLLWNELELVSPAQRAVAEERVFGVTHEAAAASILRAWRVPDDVVAGIANHHAGGSSPGGPAADLVVAGEAIAVAAFPERTWEMTVLDLPDLARWGFTPPRLARLVTRVREETVKLDRVFG
jgi:putative nucleotidyltransferase with HDIG domain